MVSSGGRPKIDEDELAKALKEILDRLQGAKTGGAASVAQGGQLPQGSEGNQGILQDPANFPMGVNRPTITGTRPGLGSLPSTTVIQTPAITRPNLGQGLGSRLTEGDPNSILTEGDPSSRLTEGDPASTLTKKKDRPSRWQGDDGGPIKEPPAKPPVGAGGEQPPIVDPTKNMKPIAGLNLDSAIKAALNNFQLALYSSQDDPERWLLAALSVGVPAVPPGYKWNPQTQQFDAATKAEMGWVQIQTGKADAEGNPTWEWVPPAGWVNLPPFPPELQASLAALYGMRDVAQAQYFEAVKGAQTRQTAAAATAAEEAATIAQEQRQAINFENAGDVLAGRKVAATTARYVYNLIEHATPTDYAGLYQAVQANLPPPPPGFMWDAEAGEFRMREGYGGRTIAPGVQSYLTEVTEAYQAHARAQAVLSLYTKQAADNAALVFDRDDARKRFQAAMATDDLDSADEALARQRMAETSLAQAQQQMLPLTLVASLLGNPFAFAMAKRAGLIDTLQGMFPALSLPAALAQDKTVEVVSADGTINVEKYNKLTPADKMMAQARWAELMGGDADDFARALGRYAPAGVSGVTQVRMA